MSCGLCGGTSLYPTGLTTQPLVPQSSRIVRRSRLRGILVVVLGITVLVEGGVFAFLAIDPILTVIGFFVMIFGAVILLTVSGIFSGTPYRGRLLNRVERDLKRRERKKYSD